MPVQLIFKTSHRKQVKLSENNSNIFSKNSCFQKIVKRVFESTKQFPNNLKVFGYCIESQDGLIFLRANHGALSRNILGCLCFLWIRNFRMFPCL